MVLVAVRVAELHGQQQYAAPQQEYCQQQRSYRCGGIYINDSGTLNIDACSIINNAATINGGGIVNGTSGTINATSNTFDGNSAGGNGGGIYNTATITLTNNTVTGTQPSTEAVSTTISPPR